MSGTQGVVSQSAEPRFYSRDIFSTHGTFFCNASLTSLSIQGGELVSLMTFFTKSCFVAGSITLQSFPDFLNLSESCQEKGVLVQRHNASLFSKLHQMALKLIPR